MEEDEEDEPRFLEGFAELMRRPSVFADEYRLEDGEVVISNLFGHADKFRPLLARLNAPGVHTLEDVADELGIDLNEPDDGHTPDTL